MFAGVSGGSLLAAGGANFPDKKPWEGGIKHWYDQVFALDQPSGAWRNVGKLRAARGYGVSITLPQGVLCIGGADAEQHHRTCTLMTLNDNALTLTDWPALPQPCANMCGALVGDTLFVAGGIDTPTATHTLLTFWSLDTKHLDRGWQTLPAWPGRPRMLAAAAVSGGKFYLVSGTDLHADAEGKPVRTYLRDAWCFTPGTGWSPVADMPQATVASPSPMQGDAHSFLIAGGDDGALVDFEPKTKHPGFPHRLLRFDAATNAWQTLTNMPMANVVNPAVRWHDSTIIISGEARPGVRSPAVWRLQ